MPPHRREPRDLRENNKEQYISIRNTERYRDAWLSYIVHRIVSLMEIYGTSIRKGCI